MLVVKSPDVERLTWRKAYDQGREYILVLARIGRRFEPLCTVDMDTRRVTDLGLGIEYTVSFEEKPLGEG